MNLQTVGSIALALAIAGPVEAQAARRWSFEGVEVNEVVKCSINLRTVRAGHTWIARDGKYNARHQELEAFIRRSHEKVFIRRFTIAADQPYAIALVESRNECSSRSPSLSSFKYYQGRTRDEVINEAKRNEGKYGNEWVKIVRWFTLSDMDTDLSDVGGGPNMLGWFYHSDDAATAEMPNRVGAPGDVPPQNRSPVPSGSPTDGRETTAPGGGRSGGNQPNADAQQGPERKRNVCPPGSYVPNAINECIPEGIKAQPMAQPTPVPPPASRPPATQSGVGNAVPSASVRPPASNRTPTPTSESKGRGADTTGTVPTSVVTAGGVYVSKAPADNRASGLVEGLAQVGSMIQQARADAQVERDRVARERQENAQDLRQRIASKPQCDPTKFPELSLDYTNRGTIDGTECRITDDALGDGYSLTIQHNETIRFEVSESAKVVAVLLSEAGQELASTSGPRRTLQLAPGKYVVKVIATDPERSDSYLLSTEGTSRYISFRGARVVRPRRLVTCAEALGATDTLYLGSVGDFVSQQTGCNMTGGRYLLLWVDRAGRVEIQVSSRAHSAIVAVQQIDGPAYESGGYLDGQGKGTLKASLPRGLYSVQVGLGNSANEEPPSGTPFSIRVSGKAAGRFVGEPTKIQPLQATVTAVRFFAAADSVSIDPTPRTTFSTTTAYIVPELEFEMPPASGAADLVCSLLDNTGQPIDTKIGRLSPAAGAVRAKWALGPIASPAGPGKWTPGTNRLFCAADTEKERETSIVARAVFSITEGGDDVAEGSKDVGVFKPADADSVAKSLASSIIANPQWAERFAAANSRKPRIRIRSLTNTSIEPIDVEAIASRMGETLTRWGGVEVVPGGAGSAPGDYLLTGSVKVVGEGAQKAYTFSVRIFHVGNSAVVHSDEFELMKAGKRR